MTLALGLAVALLAPTSAGQEESGSASACQDRVALFDPEGDPQFFGAAGEPYPFYPTPAVDFVGYAMSVKNGSLILNATLSAPPAMGNPQETYRYWLGFNVRPHGGETQYWDVRISGTSTYDSGVLVSSNELGNLGLGEYPLIWNGAEVSVRFPVQVVQEAYANKVVEFGIPQAISDGPHRMENTQGFIASAPYYIDRVEDLDAPFHSVQDCHLEELPDSASHSEESAPMANCIARIDLSDPPGDPRFFGVVQEPYSAYPTPALDFLGYGMHLEGGFLALNATLQEPPVRGNPQETYRYWLGFNVRLPGDEIQYWDVRVAGTSTYESGTLTSSNQLGNQRLGEYTLAWNGAEVSVRFPAQVVENAYPNRDVEFGLPRASSDGPNRMGDLVSAPYYLDSVGDPLADFVPLEECTDEDTPDSSASSPPQDHETPTVSFTAAAMLLTCLALGRK